MVFVVFHQISEVLVFGFGQTKVSGGADGRVLNSVWGRIVKKEATRLNDLGDHGNLLNFESDVGINPSAVVNASAVRRLKLFFQGVGNGSNASILTAMAVIEHLDTPARRGVVFSRCDLHL